MNFTSIALAATVALGTAAALPLPAEAIPAQCFVATRANGELERGTFPCDVTEITKKEHVGELRAFRVRDNTGEFDVTTLLHSNMDASILINERGAQWADGHWELDGADPIIVNPLTNTALSWSF